MKLVSQTSFQNRVSISDKNSRNSGQMSGNYFQTKRFSSMGASSSHNTSAVGNSPRGFFNGQVEKLDYYAARHGEEGVELIKLSSHIKIWRNSSGSRAGEASHSHKTSLGLMVYWKTLQTHPPASSRLDEPRLL